MPSRRLCVFCRRREMDERVRPFCSERCKMADLGRWLTGDYRVAARPDSEADPAGSDDLDDSVEDDASPIR